MFRNKNTPESIFEIQHSYVAGGLNYTSNLASICMPITRRSGTCEYDGVEIPELGDKSTCWTPWRPTAYSARICKQRLAVTYVPNIIWLGNTTAMLSKV